MPMVTDTECQLHPKLLPMIGETMPKILHLPTAALLASVIQRCPGYGWRNSTTHCSNRREVAPG